MADDDRALKQRMKELIAEAEETKEGRERVAEARNMLTEILIERSSECPDHEFGYCALCWDRPVKEAASSD